MVSNRAIKLVCVLLILVSTSSCRDIKGPQTKPQVLIERVGICAHDKKFPPTAVLKADENMVVTVTVKNASAHEVKNLKITDIVSKGMKLVKGAPSKKFPSLAPGKSASYSYTVFSGRPKIHIIPGTKVEFDSEGEHFEITGEELYIDVQLTTSC